MNNFSTLIGSPGVSSSEGAAEISYDTEASVRNLIRSVLTREFGSVQQGAYVNSDLERARGKMIEFIMNMRSLSVAALGSVYITEADILKVCSTIKRLELQGYRNLSFIFEYCARRAVRDPLEAHQRDPLHVRHMLTFSIDVPNFDMPQEEISALECHLAESNADGIKEWFLRHGNSGVQHNKGLPAFLRRYLLDYCEVTSAPAAKAFAFELAVMDVRLSGPIGWENSRSFIATLCVAQDRRHDPLEAYMDESDFNAGILAHQHCGDADGRTYYSSRLDRFDPADLKALEQLVFDTASRTHRDDSGPRGGKRQVEEKRSWWRSIFAPSGVPAQGFSLGVANLA